MQKGTFGAVLYKNRSAGEVPLFMVASRCERVYERKFSKFLTYAGML